MKHKAFHLVVSTLSVLWLPIAIVLLTAIRTFDDIAGNGLGALPHSCSLDVVHTGDHSEHYLNAPMWTEGQARGTRARACRYLNSTQVGVPVG